VSEAAAFGSESPLFLGRYRGLRLLGSGGSGEVWLARDERSGRETAVKVVPREGRAGSRARREAQAMARLDHEHCLRVYACGRDAENVYIAYEYVPGRTFREALRAGEISDAGAVATAVQLLDCLGHVHSHGIVHRDVKPANVLLAREGEPISVRLLDFGLARFDEADTLTAAGDVPGTLAYIAPERLRGEPAGPAGDVWSVGVLLYEALAGGHPFWRPSLAETADAIAAGAPPLRRLRPDLPEPLLAAVDRALSVDPARRPSASKLARLLRRSQGERGGRATLTPELLERRVVPALLAAAFAGAGALILPFYPAHGALVLAAVAAATCFAAPRAGLAFALATPILPLGNVSLALALLYAAVALAWLALFLGEPERGLLPLLGPLLGPLAPALVPVAFVTTRSPLRRALGAAAAIALAVSVAAVRAGPVGPGLEGERHPVAVADRLVHASPGSLAVVVPAVALAALVLPLLVRHGRRWIHGIGERRSYTG
jgi:hypothetical protein